ncbi:hypothetical protein CB0940_07889 [Cercospora beticola]|uniref:Serine/threonine-protein phosphatase 4 regulatory subunit 2 n=1 Tax=Cercospora beticola TaxID=122368 RepID=A0A2G5H8U9_CERBT|nr:hypothetical protein CB0940_07889 [Cercospora beticola]PIA88956.1 hypothetical protein CB0940_07889 [Cercospora beticola]WPB03857.1 hypothetical protein RHO25_008501 [Cercospora beticola]CAK1357367.1 unnamed protein product [Cercospora beticola]
MISEEEILEQAARDGSIDIAEWPRVLESLLQRLHDIVYNEFPIPQIPVPHSTHQIAPIDPEVVASTPPPRLPTTDTDAPDSNFHVGESDAPANSQSSTKENDAPIDIAAGRPNFPPGFDVTADSQQTEAVPSPTLLADGTQLSVHSTLPPELLSIYQSSTKILQYDFSESPPYTIQRLAELVLRPKRHYRFLPAYLRALDRIVSVSSPVSDFPLPALQVAANGGFLTNGEAQVNGITERDGLGSDESLGGALLTPIPWLRNQSNILTPTSASDSNSQGELHSEGTEMVDGPHGLGGIETVTVTVNGIHSTGAPQQVTSSPIASPTLSEQSDASTGSASSTEIQLREQGAVTQGELLRQEQEAGIVPMDPNGNPMTPRSLLNHRPGVVGRDGGSLVPAIAEAAMDEGMEEQPHARGPEEIGDIDTGPQRPAEAGAPTLDMEAAVGRGRSKSPIPDVADAFPPAAKANEDQEMGEPGAPGKDPQDVEKDVQKLKEAMDDEKMEEARDADGDVVVADVDSNPVVKESEAK